MSTKRGIFGFKRSHQVMAHTAIILISIPFMLPLIWMVCTAFKSNAQIFTGAQGLSLSSFFPWPLRWQNFTDAMKLVPFATYLRNTMMLCALNVAGAVASSAVVAYGFARMEFRFRETLFWAMVATIALPSQVTMIPVFALFRSLHWTGTYLPLVVPAFFASPFYVFLLRQFFMTIPEDISEAGCIDGASEWRIFWQLYLPLAGPALATCALFQFLYTWNDFFGPLLYLDDPSQYTVAYGLQQFVSNYGSYWGQLMAAATIFTVPIIVLFFFTQKTFIEGISTTGGKG